MLVSLKCVALAFLFACLTCVTIGFKFGKKVVKLDRYDSCVEPENSPLTLTYMKLDYSKSIGTYMNGEARLTKDIPRMRVSGNFSRCASREALDTCEKFALLEPPNTCHLAEMKNAAWSGIVYAFHPPFKCPLKKGIFHIINATVDASALTFLPFEDWYWKGTFDIHEGQTLLVSICYEFRIINV